MIDGYDYLLVNDDLMETVDLLHDTVNCARNATERNKEFLEEIRQEFKTFLK